MMANPILRAAPLFWLTALTVALGALLLPDRMVGALTGDIAIHDPGMIQVDGCYYAFSTGETITIRKSCDLTTGWVKIGTVFNRIPRWIYQTNHHISTDLWAPDINQVDGRFYLYYAGSTFGSNQSVIGLATADDIEGAWTDQGLVFASVRPDNYNAIDPNLVWDDDGQAWLSFGSWWDGIKLFQIDPSTGKPFEAKPTLYSLASRQGGAIEASSILHAGDFYYLFVSFDKCCAGVSSTYRIMVGRAREITGPYLDKDGIDMMRGGGSQLLASDPPYIGPGGQDVMTDGELNRLVYHYYDGDDAGKSKLAVRDISFDDDGWPLLGPMF